MTDLSLAEAKSWLRERVDVGEHCPCCNQFAKVYRRKINAGMAVSLIKLYRPDRAWVHVPTEVGARSREEGKLRYWGLVEEASEPREDGGRAGWWRITPAGIDYLFDRTRLAKYALVYDGRCRSQAGELVGIRDALGTRFNYDDLMAGR